MADAGWIFSKHFLIVPLANDADTLGRAQAIADTCEQDLATLQQWFHCDFDNSRYGIIVLISTGVHLGGASNFGYNFDESSEMNLVGTYAPPGAPPNPTLRDEMARMIFVAELAEILMEFAFTGWDRRYSMGEGLSILAGETLHPTGYYATGQGPRITNWLNGTRPDFITDLEPTDVNAVSYGCAVLFLNFLRYQLGFSFESIVAAAGPLRIDVLPGKSGFGLGTVFEKLTGRPAQSAYKEFTDLLQAHLPLGQSFTPPRDNLFPLRPPNQRTLSFSTADLELNAVPDSETIFQLMKAGPLCEATVYSYHNVNVFSLLTVSGRTNGFALPAFAWAINGVGLKNPNTWTNITVPFVATDTVPGRGEAATNVALTLQYMVVSSGFTSTLSIRNTAFVGNGQLAISFSAIESRAPGDVATNFTDNATILTRRYSMGSAWARDVASCNIDNFSHSSATLKTLVHRLVEDENRPNPNPAVVRALAAAAQKYVTALDAVTRGSPGLDSAAVRVFEELEAVHAPLAPLVLSDGTNGARILKKQKEVPRQLPTEPDDAYKTKPSQ